MNCWTNHKTVEPEQPEYKLLNIASVQFRRLYKAVQFALAKQTVYDVCEESKYHLSVWDWNVYSCLALHEIYVTYCDKTIGRYQNYYVFICVRHVQHKKYEGYHLYGLIFFSWGQRLSLVILISFKHIFILSSQYDLLYHSISVQVNQSRSLSSDGDRKIVRSKIRGLDRLDINVR